MPMTLSAFLVWLVAGGCVIAASWILEQFDGFQAQTPKIKRWIQFGLSAVIGLTALAIQVWVPPAVLEQIAPFFAVLCAAWVSIFVNQMAHLVDPGKK